VLFEEIKKNAKKNNNTVITPKIFHYDFEKDISNTAKKKCFLIKILNTVVGIIKEY